MFDLDDFDAALAELDARYLAGEAAARGHMVASSRRPRRAQPARNPRDHNGLVGIDHRRGDVRAR